MGIEEIPPAQPKAGEILVFLIRRDTACADLNHLEFLPSGDAALTRRASKYSQLKAVVVQFSRARRRYERQGVLIESEALERAEAECLEDAERRERQRERRRIRDADTDQCHLATFAERILELFPNCPPTEARAIAAHACRKHSGRVGRSAAAKQFDPQAIRLAVTAAVRHRFTDYDERLLAGCDRHQARLMVQPAVQGQLNQWSAAEARRGPDRLQG